MAKGAGLNWLVLYEVNDDESSNKFPQKENETGNQPANDDTAEARTADPIDLVNQQLEQQPTIDPEEVVNNPAITP